MTDNDAIKRQEARVCAAIKRWQEVGFILRPWCRDVAASEIRILRLMRRFDEMRG